MDDNHNEIIFILLVSSLVKHEMIYNKKLHGRINKMLKILLQNIKKPRKTKNPSKIIPKEEFISILDTIFNFEQIIDYMAEKPSDLKSMIDKLYK
jgi:hypothetical protein